MSILNRLTEEQKQEKAELVSYELWRQDDNGHKFLIETFPGKPDAVRAPEEFEKLHHKQTYRIEKKQKT